nr:putative ribonuclease H-like domain-containing protein [Tanacetum cinerariifolium]
MELLKKNRTLIEAARTMLADSLLPTIFWTEAVAIAFYVLNRVLVTKPYDKTPYELLTRDKPSISYLKPFGYHVTILNRSDPLGKFDKKLDEGYIVGYSISSKVYRGLVKHGCLTLIILLTLNYSRVSSTNLTAGSQGATPSNAGSQEDDSDSDDEPDVLIIQSTPTLVVPIVDEATTQNNGTKSDLAITNADNLDELTKLQALQRKEQVGTEEADRLGLAFPSLDLFLGVGSASISSSISAGSTPPIFAGSTPLMSPCASLFLLIDIPFLLERVMFLLVDMFLPEGHLVLLIEHHVELSDIHDGLKIFDCPKSGIFTSSSYDEEFVGPDAHNLERSLDICSTITKRIHNIHPTSQVLGDINSPIQNRRQVKHMGSSKSTFISYINDQRRNNHTDFQLCMFSCFLSQEEPTTVAQALADPDWVEAMQAEMQQFKNQKVWVLITLPDEKRAIGTKWILKNKKDARGIVYRNNARLVAQGHRQEEGIDYSDVFAPVARIKAIRLFLAFASFMGFRVYQMDVKSDFLYGKIVEEVYVTQPRGFEDPDHPKKVYKVVKALYGLHQAPRAWYERLSTFLLKHEYRRGTINKTLFIKKDSKDIMLVQVYVDDIIFGSTRKAWCEEFETLMQSEFEMSSMGPLTFFLRLQVDQRPDGIFIHQEKKSTTGGCQFLGRRLISWQCKKQTIVATSSCEAEYVAAASCCGQQTKHIEIRHHFIRDANEKKLIQVLKIPTEHNVADLLTKSFDVTRFGYLVVNIGLMATIDGTAYTVTEASIRSALQLDDLNAIDTMTNEEIFAGLRDIGAVDLTTAKDHHQHLKRSGETLESMESNKLKSSHSTEQPVELLETTYVSAGATIAVGDPIPAATSVSAAFFIPAETPIAVGVSTTIGASGFASEVFVPIIKMLDSPPKDTSLPLDLETEEHDVPLRKSSRKKSIARRRTLPSPSKSESVALSFDKDDPKAEFKKYLRQVSNDDEPAEPVSLALVSDICTWEIIPTEFGLGDIHVITRANGTVKRFSTLRELMYWAGRADLMVLYGMVLDKYKIERATGIGLGLWSNFKTLITTGEDIDASIIWDDQNQWEIRSWRFYALLAIHVLETEAGDIIYMFVDKKYPLTPETIQRMLNYGIENDRDPAGNDLTTAIQLIQSVVNQLNPVA